MCGRVAVRRSDLLNLVHRREIDLLLRVEAGAQRPLVQQREQRSRLDEAERLRIRQHVQRELERHAEFEQPVLRAPRFAHRFVVDRLRRGFDAISRGVM
jgi:hypothetical protein